MTQLIEFILNHYLLVGAFLAVLGALIFTAMQGSGGGLSPQRAVLLLNHDDAVAIDVRSEAEFKAGHIINAEHVPLADLKQGTTRLDRFKDRPLLVYCESGSASGQAVAALKRRGFAHSQRLQGGLAAWRAESLPLEAGK